MLDVIGTFDFVIPKGRWQLPLPTEPPARANSEAAPHFVAIEAESLGGQDWIEQKMAASTLPDVRLEKRLCHLVSSVIGKRSFLNIGRYMAA
jgi:hypothetical protein